MAEIMNVPTPLNYLMSTKLLPENESPVSLMTKTQTALVLLCCSAGGAKPKGKRSTEEDFKVAMSFLQGVSLEQLSIAQNL